MSTGWSPYQEWYPYFAKHVLPQFANNCSEAMNTPHTVDAWCQAGAVCIFNNINAYTQAELSGAAVLLGLTPAILAVLSPSDNSLAVLSTERPVLSLMLAAGTATLSVGYPFSRQSPLQPLIKALDTIWTVDSLSNKLSNTPILISIVQYLLAAAAIANTVQMSYDITRKTIVTWSCPNWAWVLCWSFVPLFLHTVNMIIIRHTVTRTAQPSSRISPVLGASKKSSGIFGRIWDWMLDKELRPCCERVLPSYVTKYSLLHQIEWWLPRLGAYLQYVMGTAIFSSLAFVPISDAFPIIVRYGLSAITARCILGLELQSLKCKNHRSEADGMVTSPKYDPSSVLLPRRALTLKEQVHVNEIQLIERPRKQPEPQN
ncbi:hypothetical protein AMS68_001507 [Peltaster fructicola]|uniref:Uncharacterized protein n=1 Tax=Peltaster fructicola TaxID=286661 RepID=A0A6H0XNC5_9PEZI|nr:hypothetical protein AMS68_001507 [Peltaster fructicola]